MLQSLQLENFKAFGERACIPFAPITLIFGENSSGKSSILQALNLLKQTRESRETGALLLPRAENGIVDLGSFQEMIFDHDLNRTLSIRVEAKFGPGLAIEFSFKRPSLEAEVLLDTIKIYHGNPSKNIARFRPSGTTEESDELLMKIGALRDSTSFQLPKLTRATCVWLTEEPVYWKQEFEWCRDNKQEIVSWIEKRISDLESLRITTTDEDKKNFEYKTNNEEFSEEESTIRKDLKSLNEKFEFFSLDF